MSEHSIQLRSQASLGANTSVDSSGNPILPSGLTQAQKHAINKPRFIEFTCSHVEVRKRWRHWRLMSNTLDGQVHRYVVLVTNAVVPKSLWGTKSNFKLVLQSKALFCLYPESKVTDIQALSSLSVVDDMNH